MEKTLRHDNTHQTTFNKECIIEIINKGARERRR